MDVVVLCLWLAVGGGRVECWRGSGCAGFGCWDLVELSGVGTVDVVSRFAGAKSVVVSVLGW